MTQKRRARTEPRPSMRGPTTEALGKPPTAERVRRRPGVRDASPERGSATVLVVGIVAAAVLFAGAFAAMGQASAARHRAQGAADAAALAGAARVLLGEGEACGAAADMVAVNDADFVGCEVSDLEVTVYVTVDPAGIPAIFGPARAVSRAGPVVTE